jgi:hypothetical protein
MKSLVGWHELYDLLIQIRDNIDLKVFRLVLHARFPLSDYIMLPGDPQRTYDYPSARRDIAMATVSRA